MLFFSITVFLFLFFNLSEPTSLIYSLYHVQSLYLQPVIISLKLSGFEEEEKDSEDSWKLSGCLLPMQNNYLFIEMKKHASAALTVETVPTLSSRNLITKNNTSVLDSVFCLWCSEGTDLENNMVYDDCNMEYTLHITDMPNMSLTISRYSIDMSLAGGMCG